MPISPISLLFPLDASAAAALEGELVCNPKYPRRAAASKTITEGHRKKLEASPWFRLALSDPVNVPQPILKRFHLIVILEYCTDASGLTLGGRTRLLTDAIGLLSHLDLSTDDDMQFSDSHLSLIMSFKTQLFLSDLDKNGLPKRDILLTFDEELPFDLEPLAKDQYLAVKRKWKNMLKKRGSEILAVKTRTLKALQERFPYAEFLQELKSFLGIIAGNVNRTFPPTEVIEMVREQQRIATEALNTVTVASPPKKRARQRETGPSRSPSPVAPVAREEVAQTTRAAKAIASGTSKTQASPGHGMSRYSGSVVWDSAPTSTARDDGVLAQSQEEEEEQEDIVLTPEEQDYHPDEYWSRPPYDEELFYESEPSEEEIYSDWEADSIAEESQHKRSRHDEGQSRPRHQQQASQSPPREQPRATHSSPHRRTVYCLEDIQELPMYPPASQLVGNNASKGLELLENSTEEVLELEKAISILSTRKKDIRTHMEDLRRHLTKLEQGIPPSLPGGMPRAFSIPRAGPSSSSFSTPRAGHSSSSPRGDENVLRSKKFREPRKKRLWSDEESAALKEAFRRYGHSAREIKAAIGKHGQILQHWDAGSIRSRIRVMTRKKEL